MARSTMGADRRVASGTPRVKIWIELQGRYAFGHGLCRILDAVDAAGSIKDAAARLRLSYRYVWGRIKEAEQAIGRPLVVARVGGQEAQRSTLTNEARRLVRAFTVLRQDAIDSVEREFARRFGRFR